MGLEQAVTRTKLSGLDIIRSCSRDQNVEKQGWTALHTNYNADDTTHKLINSKQQKKTT